MCLEVIAMKSVISTPKVRQTFLGNSYVSLVLWPPPPRGRIRSWSQESSSWRIKCVATFPHLLQLQASWATLNMHAFKLTRPFALILAIVCLAIAAPNSGVHADPGSDAVVHAAGNFPDSAVIEDRIATHLPAATSTTDETGDSTLKPDLECSPIGGPCLSDSDCCPESDVEVHCVIDERFGPLVSSPLSVAENGKPCRLTVSPSLYQGQGHLPPHLIMDFWGLTQVIVDSLGCESGQYFIQVVVLAQ